MIAHFIEGPLHGQMKEVKSPDDVIQVPILIRAGTPVIGEPVPADPSTDYAVGIYSLLHIARTYRAIDYLLTGKLFYYWAGVGRV